MITRPAHTTQFFIIAFLSVILIILGGVIWLKSDANNIVSQPTQESSKTANPFVTPRQQATLELRPTSVSNQYQIVTSDLSEPVNGVAFQLQSSVAITEFSTSATLGESGWSEAINSMNQTDSGSELSFSILNTTPNASEMKEEVVLGTITFADAVTEETVQLNEEESLATYISTDVAELKLSIE